LPFSFSAFTSTKPGRAISPKISGIDQGQRHESVHVGGLAVEFERGGAVFQVAHVQHRQLQSAADLLRREADALAGVHGGEHVSDQLLDFGRDFFDAGAFLPQHRMAVFDDG
jgi:hypothetical protein